MLYNSIRYQGVFFLLWKQHTTRSMTVLLSCYSFSGSVLCYCLHTLHSVSISPLQSLTSGQSVMRWSPPIAMSWALRRPQMTASHLTFAVSERHRSGLRLWCHHLGRRTEVSLHHRPCLFVSFVLCVSDFVPCLSQLFMPHLSSCVSTYIPTCSSSITLPCYYPNAENTFPLLLH